MYYLFISLIFVVCVFLVLIVLVQNSKGGGLASSFSGNNQIMGVRRTTDFLEKATWGLAAALLVFCIAASASIRRDKATDELMIERQVESAVDPTQSVNFPTTQPEIDAASQKAEETPAENK